MMKRISSLLLALVLLCSTVVLFASCGKVDVAEYRVVYADGASETIAAKVKSFAVSLKDITGKEPEIEADKKKSDVVNEDKEILIGHTGRVESAEALEKIDGVGYYIGVIGDKIVINGTTNYLASVALDEFVEKYLKDGSSNLKVKETVVSDVKTLALSSSFKFVISHTADNCYEDQGTNWGRPSNTMGDDYALHLARTFADKVVSQLGEMKLHDDESEVTANEIQLGRPVLREQTKSFFTKLDANDYGLSIADGVVVVGAMNDTTLTLAMQMFEDMYADCTYKEGRKSITLLPAEYEAIKKGDTTWVMDFPRPTGSDITLSGAVDVHDGSLEFLYTGKGIGAEAYEAYCQSLVAAGYTLYTDNTIESNQYRTYVNTTANTTLYVALNMFAQGATQNVKFYEKCIRVISASLDSVALLDENLLTPQQYIKKTDTKITTFMLNGATTNDLQNAGSAYIITLEDGTFAVIDGGTGVSSLKNEFWEVLKDLYFEVWGAYPSTSNKIKISMWYLTHGHGDHFNIFYELCKSYGSNMEIARVIANSPSDDEIYNSHDPNPSLRDGKLAELKNWVGGELKYIKVHTGQKFYLANSEFDVLYTHEDMYPWALQYFNDTGVVLKQTIHDTGNVNASIKGFAANDTPTTMLWLGDVQTRVSQWLRATYSTTLAVDMVQVSHHGSTGCEYKLYALTSASILWWPTYYQNYTQQIIPTPNKPSYKDDNAKLNNMDSVRYIVLGSAKHATVTIKAAGPDMTAVYEAGSEPDRYIEVPSSHILKK